MVCYRMADLLTYSTLLISLNGQGLAVDVDHSLLAIHVISALELRGKPRQSRCDSRPEYTADLLIC